MVLRACALASGVAFERRTDVTPSLALYKRHHCCRHRALTLLAAAQMLFGARQRQCTGTPSNILSWRCGGVRSAKLAGVAAVSALLPRGISSVPSFVYNFFPSSQGGAACAGGLCLLPFCEQR